MQPIELLLIEDNPGDVELTCVGLQEARIAVDMSVIYDGEQAIDYFERAGNMPDIILLDINLPKVSGLEILNKIRSLDHSKDIPVIVMSSSTADADIKNCYAGKANKFLTKPVDFNNFYQIIKSLELFWLTVVKLPETNKT